MDMRLTGCGDAESLYRWRPLDRSGSVPRHGIYRTCGNFCIVFGVETLAHDTVGRLAASILTGACIWVPVLGSHSSPWREGHQNKSTVTRPDDVQTPTRGQTSRNDTDRCDWSREDTANPARGCVATT